MRYTLTVVIEPPNARADENKFSARAELKRGNLQIVYPTAYATSERIAVNEALKHYYCDGEK